MELELNSSNLMQRLNSFSIASNPSLEVPSQHFTLQKKPDPILTNPPSEM